jgi:hypothetical protein
MSNLEIGNQNENTPIAPVKPTRDPWRTMRSLLSSDPFDKTALSREGRCLAITLAFPAKETKGAYELTIRVQRACAAMAWT